MTRSERERQERVKRIRDSLLLIMGAGTTTASAARQHHQRVLVCPNENVLCEAECFVRGHAHPLKA